MNATQMTAEVREMIDQRHSAEQRGEFDTIGRIVALHTDKGIIRWPAIDGESSGPDLGRMWNGKQLIVVGQWIGLPLLRLQSSARCEACLHDCDNCELTGKTVCSGQGCGGRGTINGPFEPCPGPGCRKETGKFRPDCQTCATSGSQGEVATQIPCPTCGGSRAMTCVRCRGTLKFATCHRGGSIDWRSPLCPECEGSGYAGTWLKQDVEYFANAKLRRVKREYLALGPILAFDLVEYPSLQAKTFTVGPDAEGDLLMLVAPAKLKGSNKAYLLGGTVEELKVEQAVSA